jgi:hypothetical protein
MIEMHMYIYLVSRARNSVGPSNLYSISGIIYGLLSSSIPESLPEFTGSCGRIWARP